MNILLIVIGLYLIILALLIAFAYRSYRRVRASRQYLSTVLDQMIYIHAGYLYDLRATGFNTNQIDARFAPKTQWVQQDTHMSMDFVRLYQSLQEIAQQVLSQTGARLFDPKLTQDTDMQIQTFVKHYTRYQKIRTALTRATAGLYRIFDVYKV